MEKGKIIILTAPSGSGKTTLARFLLSTFDQLQFSVSATTRQPRVGETHGKDYYFLDKDQFLTNVSNHLFFEYQEVYSDLYYGTLKSEMSRIWSLNKIPLLDIDVKGAYNIETTHHFDTLSIFVKASSIEVLKNRLISRGTDSMESIEKRLQKANSELDYARYFDYVITNDKLDLAQLLLKQIVSDFIHSPS